MSCVNHDTKQKIKAVCSECRSEFYFHIENLKVGEFVECEECFTTLEIKECEIKFFPVLNKSK